MIEFTLAGQCDSAAIARLAGEIWREHYSNILSQGQIDYMLDKFQSEEAVSASMRDGYSYWLIRFGGETCGYAATLPEEGRIFLSKLYVKKCARRQGAAKAFLDMLGELCSSGGISEVYLTVNRNNPAIEAYKRLGFSVIREAVTDIGGGYVMDDFVMRRKL